MESQHNDKPVKSGICLSAWMKVCLEMDRIPDMVWWLVFPSWGMDVKRWNESHGVYELGEKEKGSRGGADGR